VSGSAVACLFCLPESMDSGITSGSIESLFQMKKESFFLLRLLQKTYERIRPYFHAPTTAYAAMQ